MINKAKNSKNLRYTLKFVDTSPKAQYDKNFKFKATKSARTQIQANAVNLKP